MALTSYFYLVNIYILALIGIYKVSLDLIVNGNYIAIYACLNKANIN